MAKKLAYDRVLFTIVIVLVGLGLTMVYSASGVGGGDRGGSTTDGQVLLVKQAVAAALGLIAMWVMMHLDYRVLARRGLVWLGVGGALFLLTVALLGPELNSTNRWIRIGFFSLQPSELAKLVLVPFLAYQVARRERAEDSRDFVIPSLLVGGLLTVMVLVGRDLGSALMLTGITLLVLFLAGMPWSQLLLGLLIAFPAAVAAVWFEPYRKRRLLAFLAPEQDPLGAGFQAIQSLIAIGSGGLFGVGLGNGLQKLHFVPYPHSDFVYAIIGEELGLIGALGVVLLFGILCWRGIVAGLRAPDTFGRYLAWGFTAALTLQALVHISVVLGLLPATGVTLPFISYGGSSLVVTLVASGVLLNISQHG
jgi:cell division protein FtsW